LDFYDTRDPPVMDFLVCGQGAIMSHCRFLVEWYCESVIGDLLKMAENSNLKPAQNTRCPKAETKQEKNRN